MILCLRCSNGDVTLHDETVAFQLRISNDEWVETKGILVGSGLITNDNKPTKWNKRQYVSDNSTARVQAFREKKKRQCNVSETVPDTDTDTDTENKGMKQKRFTPPSFHEVLAYIKEKNLSVSANGFMNFYESKGWMVGKNKMKDWKAAIRGWETRNKDSQPKGAPQIKEGENAW